VVRNVDIRDEAIRLGQFLKLASIADSGSGAKRLLETGQVRVNGESETRRGRRLLPGDIVSVAGDTARVVLSTENAVES
jgi:ribosome-associated protein